MNSAHTINDIRGYGAIAGNLQPQELRKLILKLRWIGMESEAEELRHALNVTALAPEIFVDDTIDTD